MSGDRALLMLLILAVLARPSAAFELGRLFTTPAERARMDHPGDPRHGNARPGDSTGTRHPLPSAPEKRPDLNGFVLRSSGANTYWLQASPKDHGGSAVAQ